MRPLGRGGNAGRFVGPGLDTGPRRQLVAVPEDVANALASETRRNTIPTRTGLGVASPFSGELYEQAATTGFLKVPGGATIVLATLRRAWPLVGFAVNPGDGAGTLTAFLRVYVDSIQSAVVNGTALAIPAGPPLASQAFFIAARAELVVHNTGAAATRVRGTVYGMNG